MKHYTISFKPKRLHRIPKKQILLMALFGIPCILLLIDLLLPVKYRLSNLENHTVHIDEIQMVDTLSRRGSRMKLVIQDDNTTYYLHYPQKTLKEVSQALDDDLFSGKISSVEATVAKPSLRNYLTGHRRIVDLRSDANIYYDLETERESIHQGRIAEAIILVVYFPFTLTLAGLILLSYGILEIDTKKHRK